MTQSKERTQNLISFFLLALLAVCLVWQSAVIEDIRDALMLCYTTVIPSLFPFMVLSDVIRQVFPQNRNNLVSKCFARLFSTTECGFYPFLMGILCGFPIGVREVCALYQKHSLTKEEANHLLGFVNQPGPAFVIAGIGGGLRGSITEGIMLYCIQIATSLFVARITAKGKNKGVVATEYKASNSTLSFPRSVANATMTMLTVCGMICTFSAIASLLRAFLPSYISVFAVGILEIVNGTKGIFFAFKSLPLLSFALTSATISFSGLSVHMQANLFIGETDLSFPLYLRRKVVSAFISFCLALIIEYLIILH